MTPLDPERAGDLAAALKDVGTRGRPPPVVAAAVAEAAMKVRAGAGPLALFCADAALARALGWPVTLPLLAPASSSRARLRATGGGCGRARPAGASASRSAMRAPRSAALISPRTSPAARRASPRPRQSCGRKETRARSRRWSPTAPSPPGADRGLSDRARRRLFERLVALGAARELTGRATFRLYGL